MADTTTIQANRTDSVIEVQLLGGPPGPKGDAAEIYIKGVATAWPPVDHPAVGDLYVIPTTPPTGAPAWAVASHGAFWDGTAWVDAGLLVGPKGDRGEPGPPLNIKGTALAWVPDAAPKAGDLWILPDPLPAGTPAGFTAGGAAAWDAVKNVWVPLTAIRGPAGHSVAIYGPSPTPPVGVTLYKGDMWLASDPALFSPTFDPSGITPAPGPAGPAGPTGPSAYEVWKLAVGRPTAPMADFLDAIRGATGATGPKGDAGETLKVEGVVADEASLPAAPPNLTVYMTRAGVLFIYNPTSAAAAANGWVSLGKIAGPAGRAAHVGAEVARVADLPTPGGEGLMVSVKENGHLYGWDAEAPDGAGGKGAWVDGGKLGGSSGTLDPGTAQGQILRWDNTARVWIAGDPSATVPEGTAANQTLVWDAGSNAWAAATQSLADLSDVDDVVGNLPQFCVLGWDPNLSKWVDSRSIEVDDIAFDATGPATLMEGIAAASVGGLDPTRDTFVPSCQATAEYVRDVVALEALADTKELSKATNGQVPVWSAANSRWEPGSSAAAINDLTDVTLSSPSDGQLIRFNATTAMWENATPDFLNTTNGYTKVEVDGLISAITTGLEHFEPVISRANTPPASPANGDLYIVNVAPSGAWAGQANKLALWNGTAWTFTAPKANETHLVQDVAETWHWNGTAWVQVAVASTTGGPAAAGELWMVGDVKQSILLEPAFINELPVAERTKWVLADGRTVTGSRYATITGNNNVPDLRGSFLRMSGNNAATGRTHWSGGAVGNFGEDGTARPKNHDFTGTTNTTGSHEHTFRLKRFFGAAAHDANNYNPGGTYDGTQETTNANGDHQHTVTINGGGDNETRPKHFCLNFYIKIN